MCEKKIAEHHVEMAIQAVEVFCKKYDVTLNTPIIVSLAIALREQEELEWTPLGKAFRRILFTQARTRLHKDRIAVVMGYDQPDQEKTKELNELINRFTKNALA